MSVSQIPTSRKTDYLVYLGFAGALSLLIMTNLPSDLTLALKPHSAVFLTVITTSLAGALFAVRMDKVVDWIITRCVWTNQRKQDIVEFIARVLVFLRFWEVTPTRTAALDKQAKDAVKSIIEGEDLHEEIWTQKGIFFLMSSVVVIAVTVILSDTAQTNISLLVIGLVLVVLGPAVLAAIWVTRYETFPERCIDVLEFRYYQDRLLTERLLRSEKKATSKENSGTPTWAREGYKDIRWNSGEFEEYKDALVNQCDEIDKILRRKEWNRFKSQFLSVRKMLEKSTDAFIANEALGFAILSWADLLISQDHVDVEEREARYDSYRLSIEPLVKTQPMLESHFLGCKASNAKMDGLLNLIQPEDMNPTLRRRVGEAIGIGLLHGGSPGAFSRIEEWLSGESRCVLATLKILDHIDPMSFEKILQNPTLSEKARCIPKLLEAIQTVSYTDAKAAFPLLAALPKEPSITEEVVKYLRAAITCDNQAVRLWAIDSLAQMDIDFSQYRAIIQDFASILYKGQDLSVLAVLFALEGRVNLLSQEPLLTNALFGLLPHRNQYLQMKVHRLLRDCGAAKDDFGEVLLELQNRQIQPGNQRLSGLNCGELIQHTRDSDRHSAIGALVELHNRASKCLDNIEAIRGILDAARSTAHSGVKILVAAVIGMYASLIAQEDHRVVAGEIFEMTKEISQLDIRNTFGYALGNLDQDIQFELADRVIENTSTVLAAIAVYYMQGKLSPYSGLMRGMISIIEKNSDTKIACMLAAMSLGPIAQNYPALLDKIINIMESSDPVLTACALESLRAIGGERVRNAVKFSIREMDHWWLRKLRRDCLR